MIAAIADDFTGAADVAVAFRRAGMRVRLVFGVPDDALQPSPDAGGAADEAVVVALKSRTIPAARAVGDSLRALAWARARGHTRFFFKHCSTFDSTERGNIGPVADALADELGAEFTAVTPASPVHERVVFEGQLFVAGQLLAESPMREHPLTPMTDSSVLRLLSAQTRRRVALVRHSTVRRGAEEIGREFERLRAAGVRYAVVDAIDDDELRQIGDACLTHPLVVGAAGLAAGWAAALRDTAFRDTAFRDTAESVGGLKWPAFPEEHPGPAGPAVVLSGSCSERTLHQVAHLRRTRPSFQLDAEADRDPSHLAAAALAWFDSLPDALAPLIFSSAPPEEVRRTHQAAGVAEAADLVERAMGAIAVGLVERGVTRLVVAGGETSGAVTSALGVRSAVVGREEAPGVPWLYTDGPRALRLLLKSGNFGGVGLLEEASRPDDRTGPV